MKVASNSKWTLNKISNIQPEAGVSPLEQFASTPVPNVGSLNEITSLQGLMAAFQRASGSARRVDLCPAISPDQSGQLTIIPFAQIPNYVKPGDIVTFVTDTAVPDWSNQKYGEMLKQRGWHAEMITTGQSKTVLRGPWGGSNGVVAITPADNVKSHQWYSSFPSIWNLHICRFSPPNLADQARFDSLMQGLEAWATILPQTNWPQDMAFNPILFSDVNSLLRLGDSLIQRGPLPKMFCIEWVNAVFSLACCYPLTKKFLNSRGALLSFTKNFPAIKFLDDALEPFSGLPWAAYSEEYIIESFAKIYFSDDLTDQFADELLTAAKVPRQPVIMPIVPLLEMRKRSNPANFNVQYICTAVEDSWCVPQ